MPTTTSTPDFVAIDALAARIPNGALIIAGGFTLLPGRIMHHVVFGG